ncbi:MAG: hypothetical protein VXY56_04740 [Pseudomonadota bacterium]|nr:hypothetical protein [Pseudomonadota bacterium]
MALLAEQIVEEWLRRDGFFTIRGLKLGIQEIDLLAIKVNQNKSIEAKHVEVQVSNKPVTYISGISKALREKHGGVGARSAKYRNLDLLKLTVKDWIDKKYNHPDKVKVRNKLAPEINWTFLFVHGKVHPKKFEELELISDFGIERLDIETVITQLRSNESKYATSSGSDIIDLMQLIIE